MAAKFELKTTASGKVHFTLKAPNGKIILSSEQYESKSAAKNGIDSVKENAGAQKRFEIRESEAGPPYFVLKAANGQEIGRSESYSGLSAAKNGIASVNKNAPDARVVDLTG